MVREINTAPRGMTTGASPMDRRTFLKMGAATAGAALTAPAVAFTLTRKGAAFPATIPSLPRRAGPAERPNVLLIVLDTVRADHLSCYGYDRPTTPRIDAFAAQARRYTHALSPSCWTLPSHASFFTGLPGSAHGVGWTHLRLDEQFTTLAEQLRAAGYQTAGLSSNPMVSAVYGLTQGFDFYRNYTNPVAESKPLAERLMRFLGQEDDDSQSAPTAMHRRLGRWFRQDYRPDKPFFLFLNYFDPHAPYVPPSHLLEWASRQILEKWRRADQLDLIASYQLGLEVLTSLEISELEMLHDEELRYTDLKVGELLDFFDSTGLSESTLIIITSDHGEHFGEHHLMEHQYSLYEPLVRVPLLVRYRDRFAPGKDESLVQSHDLYPTILELAGIRWKKEPAHNCQSLLRQGGSASRMGVAELLAPQPLRVASFALRFPAADFSRFLQQLWAVQLGDLKLIRRADGRRELYHLPKDRLEERDLAEQQPRVVRRLDQALDQWLRSFKHYEPPPLKMEDLQRLPREHLNALRGLGYVR